LCHWHVNKKWNDHRAKIKDSALQKEMLGLLYCLLRNTYDRKQFERLLNTFIQTYREKAESKNFIDDYFVPYYCGEGREAKWATTNRRGPHFDSHTNNYAESFRSILSRLLGGENGYKRMDLVLDSLTDLENTYALKLEYDRRVGRCSVEQTPLQRQKNESCHSRGIKIK